MDEPLLTVSLSPQDWGVILKGVYKLTLEEAAAVANRLQIALADAQRTPEKPPENLKIVEAAQ